MFECLKDSIVSKIGDVSKEQKLSQKINRMKASPRSVPQPAVSAPDHQPKQEPSSLVEHVPTADLPGLDDGLYKKIISELDSMQLTGDSGKVYTKWLSPSSESYNYSKVVNKPFPLSDYQNISKLMEIVNSHQSTTGDMDSCLVSRFNSHKTSLSLHRDDEPLISQSSSICTMSFGAPRHLELVFDGKKNFRTDLSLPATDRTLNIMKPGCQQAMRHRVPPGKAANKGSPSWRFSLSFRKLAQPSTSQQQTQPTVPTPPSLSTPNSNSITEPNASTTLKTPPKYVNLIAGDSFVARLDVSRLGKGKQEVVNIAKGGSKISTIQKSLEVFHSSNPSTQVKKLFLSFGANDIRHCERGIRHLKNAVGDLMKTAKKLFPDAKIWIQSIPPVHPNGASHIPRNVMAMNNMLFDCCSRYKLFYLDVFWAFLDRFGNRNDRLFPKYDSAKGFYDIHPSPRAGMPVLARIYIHIIHSKWFNPMGY